MPGFMAAAFAQKNGAPDTDRAREVRLYRGCGPRLQAAFCADGRKKKARSFLKKRTKNFDFLVGGPLQRCAQRIKFFGSFFKKEELVYLHAR